VQDGAVRSLTRIDTELLEQAANADPCALVAYADPYGAILVMHAHRDHRALEPRIADPGHGEQQLAGEKARRFHSFRMNLRARCNKP
jgi:hypothetical protein